MLASFYYAYALSKTGEPLTQVTAELVCSYLARGLEHFVSQLSSQLFSTDSSRLFSEDYFSVFNAEFLEAFLIIGRLKSEFGELRLEIISTEDAYR